MIGWLLDTNVISELARARPDPRVLAWARAQPEERFFISVLSLGEYEKGLNNLPPSSRLRHRIAAGQRALEARFGERLLPLSNPVVRRWGAVSGAVQRSTGRPPPVIDTLFAATALEHDLCLATRNTADIADTGVALFNPWTDDPEAIPVD